MNKEKTFLGFLWQLAKTFGKGLGEIFLMTLAVLVMFGILVALIIVIPESWYAVIGTVFIYGICILFGLALVFIVVMTIWDTWDEYYKR